VQIHLLEYLDQTLRRFPDRTALSDGCSALTFREVEGRAARLATALARLFPETRQPVAVCIPKTPEAVIAFLAVLMTGNAYLPLDPKSPPERLRVILESIDPAVVITDGSHGDLLAQAGFPGQRILLADGVLPDAPDRPALASRREVLLDTDPAYLITTSGSTGVPKGVAVGHRSIIDYIDWAKDRFSLDETLVIGNQAPFVFDNSTLDIYLCLALGAELVLIPEELFSFPARLMAFVAERGVNFIFWVPSVLIHVANLGILDAVPVPALRQVFFAGEVMPNRTLNHWRQRLPQAQFVNLYGPTEITVDCTYFVVDRPFADEEPLPIGFPCRNTGILLLNEVDQPCAPGEQGELCVRGGSLALGYWNDPEKTAQAFVQNPLNSHYPERIYRTGDLVRTNPRGEILFLGRKDHQIKHLGYRIELLEIEQRVLAMPGLDNACVVYDHLRREITLFYQSFSPDMAPASIRRHLAVVLPKYMLPTSFHRLDHMPLLPHGKIDRAGLQARLLNPSC